MEERKIIIFTLGDEYYGADIGEVERILEYTQPNKVPDLPEVIEGVIKYEGKILPILNLFTRFDIEINNKNKKIVVIKDGEERVGIVVNDVSEVKDIAVDTIENPPEITSSISKRYLKGLIKLEDRIVIYLALNKVLREEEKEKIY